MICFTREFVRKHFGRRRIPIAAPASTIVITGSRRESIDAVIDGNRRIRQLIIHTRWRSKKFRYHL